MHSSVNNLDFDWEHYLTLAYHLHQDCSLKGCDEAKWRCSISRAYYAVFGKAKCHLVYKENQILPKIDVHSWVIKGYSQNRSREKRKIGKNLERLRINRTMADYEEYTEVTFSMAQTSIILAKATMRTLKEL
ncbi:MAG TPA: hypothetical protein ENN05_02505 [Deltaproteobacteria bacterium]|mgnify:CR=1 FL=1|nr:hypothetical protein [Deltaproteobacteria bacterium]